MTITPKEVLLDAFLGDFLIKKESKKTHKIKDNFNNLRQSLRSSIIVIYNNFIVPKKIKVEGLKDGIEVVTFSPNFEQNFKAFTGTGFKGDFFDIVMNDSIVTKLVVPFEILVPPDSIKWKFGSDNLTYFSKTNFLCIGLHLRQGQWSGGRTDYKASTLLKKYIPVCEKIIDMQFSASRNITYTFLPPNRQFRPDLYTEINRVHLCGSDPEDLTETMPFVSGSALTTNIVDDPDVKIKGEFASEVCNFIAHICREERLEIFSEEIVHIFSNMDCRYHIFNIEIGFDTSYHKFRFLDKIMELIREYIDFGLIHNSQKSQNIIENRELLGVPIFNDLFNFVIKILLPKFLQMEYRFSPSFTGHSFSTFNFLIFTFDSRDPNFDNQKIRGADFDNQTFKESAGENTTYPFPEVENVAFSFEKYYGKENRYENCVHWTYIGEKNNENNKKGIDLKVNILNHDFMVKNFLTDLSAIEGDIIETSSGE